MELHQWFFLHIWPDHSAFMHLPKSESSLCMYIPGCTLQVSLPGQESTQELPATCGDQFAQWPSLQQDFALCCMMMCTKVSCKGFSSQSLECINYVRSRQLLLQYSPGVLIIGKDTLPTRGKAREREALCVWRGWRVDTTDMKTWPSFIAATGTEGRSSTLVESVFYSVVGSDMT